MRIFSGLCAALIALFTTFLHGAEMKEKSIELNRKGLLSKKTPYVFDIDVCGNVDGSMYADPPGCYFPWRQNFFNNKFISIENKGGSTVRNPWLTLTGGIDFFSAQTIIESIIPGNASDKEKARLIYEFNRKHYFHEYNGSSDNIDPVKLYNAYGYGICGDNAAALTALFQQAGLKTRAGHPYGHSTTEVFYGNGFHYLDGDEFIVALKSDNEGVAGEEDFVRDPYLLKRTHSYGLKNWGWAKFRDDVTASLFWHKGKRDRNHHTPDKPHTMAFDLRPNEKITWFWRQKLKPLGRYNNDGKRDRNNKSFNGEWLYAPSPEQKKNFTKNDCINIPFRLPYPIAGVSIKALPSDSLKVSLSCDGKKFKQVDKKIFQEGLLNDEFLEAVACPRQLPPPYKLWVKLESCNIEKTVINPLAFKLYFQAAPKSLLELRLGQNRFNYRDDSKTRNIEITVGWQEKSGQKRPEAPSEPLFPKEDESVKGSRIVFKWQPAKAANGGKIVDYQFQLSEHPDFRWTLSSNFDALLSYTKYKGKCEFALTHCGLLNPGIKYYWRIRGRDEKGCWSSWSKPWSFFVDAPGMPLTEEVKTDMKNRKIDISWKEKGGTLKAKKYRLYGSEYRGFTPALEKHQMLFSYKNGKADYKEMPPNLIAEIDGPHISINFDDPSKIYPFYRLQAVASDGTEGAYSAQVEIPGPLLLSHDKIEPKPGETNVPLNFLKSAGRISNLNGHGVECSIAHGDAWAVEVMKTEGADDLSIQAGEDSLLLSRTLKDGESVTCMLKVVGTSYFNQDKSGTFILKLLGKGNGKMKKAPSPDSHNNASLKEALLLGEDFTEPLSDIKKDWTVDPPTALVFMRKTGNENFLCIKNGDSSWARISKKLKRIDEKHLSDITVEFSLLSKTAEMNCSFELRLVGSSQNWIFLKIGPWKPLYIAGKVEGKNFRAHSQTTIPFEYNKAMNYKWIIKADGSQEIYEDSRLIWRSGKQGFSLQDFLGKFQAAFSLGESPGFMGIGNIKITYQGLKK